MNTNSKLSDLLPLYIWLLLTLCLFITSILQSSGAIYSYIITNATILLIYIFYSNGISLAKYQKTLILFAILYLYTISTSVFVVRSAINALGLFASFLFFCTINDLQLGQLKHKNNNIRSLDYVRIIKLALGSAVFANALFMLMQYLLEPIRTTGLFNDYSQASMSILLAFGLIYPLIKTRIIFTPITLIFFLGFFTSFSRSANFLLILFLGMLFMLELKNKDLINFFKICVIIILAAGLVYLYPFLIGAESVDRGGFSHLSTLNSRTVYWQAAWDAIQLKPWTGHGLVSYQFTGIQSVLPHHRIFHIHNDYLQVWHDLGIVWFVIFVYVLTKITLKYSPIIPTKVNILFGFGIKLKLLSDEKIISWYLLLCIILYMMINFLILSSIFQLITCLIIVDLVCDDEA